jgi:hypothetical protein
VERLRARARPSGPAAACVAIASVGRRSGDGEISGNGTTTMCCWCCGRRDARTAFPQRRRALFASTPGRSANATRFHSCGSRKVEAEEVRSSPAGERRPAKSCSTTDGNPSSLPTQALNRTVRARRRELRNAALLARSKGHYRTWVRSRDQPLRRLEETTTAERPPGVQALPKSRRHGRIRLVRRTERFGRGLSCTRPPSFRRPCTCSVFYLNFN